MSWWFLIWNGRGWDLAIRTQLISFEYIRRDLIWKASNCLEITLTDEEKKRENKV
jgi:hypothetical protein